MTAGLTLTFHFATSPPPQASLTKCSVNACGLGTDIPFPISHPPLYPIAPPSPTSTHNPRRSCSRCRHVAVGYLHSTNDDEKQVCGLASRVSTPGLPLRRRQRRRRRRRRPHAQIGAIVARRRHAMEINVCNNNYGEMTTETADGRRPVRPTDRFNNIRFVSCFAPSRSTLCLSLWTHRVLTFEVITAAPLPDNRSLAREE